MGEQVIAETLLHNGPFFRRRSLGIARGPPHSYTRIYFSISSVAFRARPAHSVILDSLQTCINAREVPSHSVFQLEEIYALESSVP